LRFYTSCIAYTASWLNNSEQSQFQNLVNASLKNNIPVSGDYNKDVDKIKIQLDIIDELEEPDDEKGTNIDIMKIIMTNAKPLTGGTGLSAKADLTLYATLYCWKWMMIDFVTVCNIWR
jgi:hypothetical protein